MEATKKQYEFARCVVRRNEERLNNMLTKKERKINKVFYWIMDLMVQRVEDMAEYIPLKKHKIVLTTGVAKLPLATSSLEEDVFYIKEECFNKYLNIHLPDNEFYELLEDVASIFNSLPNFDATYSHKENTSLAELTIFMELS